jgi:FlaA1/EpsC-like NDP-sugar epimerase
MCSRGSVIPFFQSIASTGEIPITDERMTRFMIKIEDGVKLVWDALQDSEGGEIYVKKIPSMKVVDIAKAIAPNAKLKFIGVGPGEKLHEQMIGIEDARNTFEFADYYKILPQIQFQDSNRGFSHSNKLTLQKGKPCPEGFSYSSDNNNQWMSKEELLSILNNSSSRLDKRSDEQVLKLNLDQVSTIKCIRPQKIKDALDDITII